MTWKYKNLTTLFSPLSSLSGTCESRFLNQSQAVPEMYFTCHLESSWYKLAKGAMTRIPVEICGDEPLIVPSIFGIRIPVSGFFVLLFTIASYCLLARVLAQSVHTLHSLLNFTKVSHYLKRVLVTPVYCKNYYLKLDDVASDSKHSSLARIFLFQMSKNSPCVWRMRILILTANHENNNWCV